jgi:4-amino-4-deoxy-L-arabinose transferase-like glycosyltransferase
MDQAGEVLLNYVAPFFTALVIGATAIGFGALIAQPFFGRKHPPLIESFGLGCVAISLLTLLWGSLGWLGSSARWSLSAPLILLGFIGWIRQRPEFPFNLRSFRNRTILVIVILVIVSVLFKVILLAFYPPYAPDECSTYLPGALAIFQTGRALYNPAIPLNSLPQNTEMLYGWATSVAPLSASHFINVLAFIFSLVAIVRLGRAVFSVKTGWLAALLMGSLSAIQWMGYHSYPDMWVMFYLLAATLSGVDAYREGKPSRLMIAGIFMGAAMGSGYTGAIGALTLCISLVAIGRWRMPGARPMQREDFFAAFLIALAVASPWYIRNFIWFHNPFFPFLSDVLKPIGGIYSVYGPESSVDLARVMSRFTAASGFAQGSLFTTFFFNWPVWAAIPAGIWFWRSIPFMRIAVTWTVLTWSYWLIAGGGIINLSFYMFLVPVTILAISFLAGYIYTIPSGDRHGRFIRVVLWVILIGWVGILTTRGQSAAPPMTASERESFLSRNLKSYELIQAANRVIPKTGVAVGIYCGDARLYTNFALVGGGDIGLANTRVIADSSISPSLLAALINERYNAQYMIVNERVLSGVQDFPSIQAVINSSEFHSMFTEIARVSNGAVYYLENPPQLHPTLTPDM